MNLNKTNSFEHLSDIWLNKQKKNMKKTPPQFIDTNRIMKQKSSGHKPQISDKR